MRGLLPRGVWPMLRLVGCGTIGPEAATVRKGIPVAGTAPKLSVGGFVGAACSHSR